MTAATRRAPRAWSIAGANADAKLGTVVAALITDDIADLGWPAGQVLGSETELLQRYGVSRAVLREAIRLLEYQHVARMRRGRGGGLVVMEPDVGVVSDAAIIYLLRVDARLDEVFESRLVVEEVVAEVLPERLDEDDVVRLRALISEEDAGVVNDMQTLHRLLASSTRNPTLGLFVDLLTRLTSYYFTSRTVSTSTQHSAGTAHRKIVDAVISGDARLARRRMRTHLAAEADYMRAGRGARQVLDRSTALGGRGDGKRGEVLAREILGLVLRDKLEPGDMIGSEVELLREHDVSRGVFREAIRLLEYHHVVEMRRGSGGGLFVAEPDVQAVADVIALYLERHRVTPDQLREVRISIELAAADRVFRQPAADVRSRLQAALDAEASATPDEIADAVHDLHTAIASLSGNRVLQLLALVLIRLTRVRMAEGSQTGPGTRGEVHRAHAAIADALMAGDRSKARHRLQRHLELVNDRL